MRRSVAGLDTPPICVPQRRKGPSKTSGVDALFPLDQARPSAAAPRRELPGVQPPRTCVSVLHKRERQLAGLACRLGRSWAVPTGDQDPKARRDSGGTPPRTCSFLSIKRERQLAAPRRESTAEALRRELPGVQPPRTCFVDSISTSEASCPGRDLLSPSTDGLR